VRPRDLGLLLALGAMWGSSFLFIKVAVAEVEPAFVVACRLFFALLALVAALPLLGRLSEASEGPNLPARLAGLWRPLLVLGFLNAALPYLVISWGTQFLPSGTAAILNSTVPLFTAMLAGALPWFADERLDLLGVAGILLGIVGVGMLVGGSFGLFGQGAVMGAAGVLAGSASYAVGGLYARRKMKGVPVRVSAVGQNAAGLLVALPLAALALPREFPSLPAILSLVGLGAVGTGFSLLIYFRLIANVGATRTSTVTYLVPVWALLYGAVLLGEEITAHAILGLILILLGVAGASGIARLPRKQPPEGTPDGPGR
jgi:drug/metabolite transporter (DMT)-like permease